MNNVLASYDGIIYYDGISPIACDLDLHCMRSEELHIWIRMVEERDNKTPCFRSFLNVKQLLLEASLVLWRQVGLWIIGLLYKLDFLKVNELLK